MSKFFQASSFSVLLILSFFSLVFAQEDLTITTYYPSPNGVYDNLTVTNSMAIGTGSRGSIDTWAAGGAVAGVVLSQGVTAGYYWGGRTGVNTYALYSANGGKAQLWDASRGDIIQFAKEGASDVSIYGNTVVFRNNPSGNPAIIKAKEVWFCSSY